MNKSLKPILSVALRRLALLLTAILTPLLGFVPVSAHANIVGPYTADANTLFLFHFDEPAGSSVTANVGLKGGNCITATNIIANPGLALPPTSTNMLGKPSYPGFGNCVSTTNTVDPALYPTIVGLVGYDGNNNGVFNADINGTASADGLLMTNLNIGNTLVAPTGNSPFTIEALVNCATNIGGSINQEILCTDNANGTQRGFQFRINNNAQLEFNFIGAPTSGSKTAVIPTTGPHAYSSNAWFHVAVTYDGTNLLLYWTKLDPSSTACNQIGGPFAWNSTTNGRTFAPLIIGNENRGASTENFKGLIDEVRISSVCRSPSQMMFVSPAVTIVKHPSSQSIDYLQPVIFSVTASSTTPMGYRWRYNGTPISGNTATNNSYTIPSVDVGNAGGYDCVITNTAGFSATSHVAQLIVGCDNFLAHRWSFTSDTTDSVGGATGTNMGTATVSGGALVLDGTAGCFMELPHFLIHNSNYTAVTFEFWANYNITANNNNRIFDFGNTNFVNATVLPPENYLYFSPHAGANHVLGFAPTTQESQISAIAAGDLDGQTAMYVACVIDPPNNVMSIFTNGVLETNVTLSTSMDSIIDEKCWIGRSLFTADSYFNGSIDELRLYSGALAPGSIFQSFSQGPDVPLNAGPVAILIQPSNTTAAVGFQASLSAVIIGRQPVSYQWLENGVPIAGATNAAYTFTPTLGQSGHTFQILATNSISGTNYNVASIPATLTVRVPLNLTWAGTGGNWDITSLDWTTNANVSQRAYIEGDNVTFDNLGAAQSTVNLTQTLHPSSMTVSGSTSYTLNGGGAIAGFTSLTKSGSGTLILDTLNAYTGSTTVSGGTLQIGDGTTTGRIGSGPVTNNAVIAVNPGASGSVTLTNTIAGSGYLTMNGNSSGGLILSASNSYAGGTTISSGTLHARNAMALGTGSTVVSASGAELFVDANVDLNPEPLTLNGSGITSDGALHKGGAGLTTLGGTVALGSDTTINVDNGSTLNLTNPSGINGIAANANLTLAGSGIANVTGPVALGTGGITVNGSTWTLANPVNNYAGKTFLYGGRLIVSAAAGLGSAPGSFTADQITMGNGNTGGTLGTYTSFALNDGLRGISISTTLPSAVGFFVGSNAVLTISNSISGVGGITKSGNGTLVLNGDNSGLIGTLNIDTASTFTNDGVVRIAAPNALTANVTMITISNNNSGTSTLQLDGSAGALNISPVILQWSGRNSTVPAIENVIGNNTFSVGAVCTWNGGGGTYQIQSDAGTLTLPTDIPGSAPAGFRSLVFSGSGNILMSGAVRDGDGGANNCTNSIIKTGSGILTLVAANSNTGTNYVGDGAMLVDGSTGTNSLTVGGGKLGGIGTVNGPTIVGFGGTLSPGDLAIGTLTINNNLTFAGGNLLALVNKSLSPSSSNNLAAVSGTVTNSGAGAIIVTNLGPALALGNSFKLFSQPVLNGGTMGVVGCGVAWNNHLAVDGTISVAALTLPQPVITTVSLNGTSLVLTGNNGYTSGGYYVLSTTNLAVPRANWTRVSTNVFGGASFSVTNTVAPGAPESFFTIQLQ